MTMQQLTNKESYYLKQTWPRSINIMSPPHTLSLSNDVVVGLKWPLMLSLLLLLFSKLDEDSYKLNLLCLGNSTSSSPSSLLTLQLLLVYFLSLSIISLKSIVVVVAVRGVNISLSSTTESIAIVCNHCENQIHCCGYEKHHHFFFLNHRVQFHN